MTSTALQYTLFNATRFSNGEFCMINGFRSEGIESCRICRRFGKPCLTTQEFQLSLQQLLAHGTVHYARGLDYTQACFILEHLAQNRSHLNLSALKEFKALYREWLDFLMSSVAFHAPAPLDEMGVTTELEMYKANLFSSQLCTYIVHDHVMCNRTSTQESRVFGKRALCALHFRDHAAAVELTIPFVGRDVSTIVAKYL